MWDFKTTLACVAAFAAILSAGTSLWVALGSSRRLRSDEAKALSKRVDSAARWHESEDGKVWIGRVDAHDGRLNRAEERLSNLASREDLARLAGKIDGVAQEVKAAAEGINRIEGFFLEGAIRGRDRP